MEEDRLLKVYNAAKQALSGVPEYEKFKYQMRSEKNSREIHSALFENGNTKKGFDEFSKKNGLTYDSGYVPYEEFDHKADLSSKSSEIEDSNIVTNNTVSVEISDTANKIPISNFGNLDGPKINSSKVPSVNQIEQPNKTLIDPNNKEAEEHGFWDSLWNDQGEAWKGMGYGHQALAGENANWVSPGQRQWTQGYEELERISKDPAILKSLIESEDLLKNKHVQKTINDRLMKNYLSDMDQYRKNISDWKKRYSTNEKFVDGMKGIANALIPFADPFRVTAPKIPVHPKDDSDTNRYMEVAQPITRAKDALIANNGDVTKALEWIKQKAQEESWGDRQIKSAMQGIANLNYYGGAGGFIGSMLPQMAGTAAAIGVSLISGGQGAASLIGWGNTVNLAAMSAGNQMTDARLYAKENGIDISDSDVYSSGMKSAAIEMGTEAIPTARIIGKVTKSVTNKIGNNIVNSISRNPQAIGETEEFLKRMSGQFSTSLVSKRILKEYAKDIASETIGEFTAEALGSYIPMATYADYEDLPTIKEIFDNGLEGAKGGMFMGAVLGSASNAASNYQNKKRREEQGFVAISQTKNNGFVEVVGENNGGFVAMTSKGDVITLTKEDIVDTKLVNTPTFYKFKGYVDTENIGEMKQNTRSMQEFLTDKQRSAILKSMEDSRSGISEEFLSIIDNSDADVESKYNDIQEVVRGIESQEGLSDEAKESAIERVYDQANKSIGYLRSKEAYDGMLEGMQDQVRSEEDGLMERLNSVSMKDKSGDRYIQRVIIKGENEPSYVISGTIERKDGVISGDRSVILQRPNGKKEFVLISDIEDIDLDKTRFDLFSETQLAIFRNRKKQEQEQLLLSGKQELDSEQNIKEVQLQYPIGGVFSVGEGDRAQVGEIIGYDRSGTPLLRFESEVNIKNVGKGLELLVPTNMLVSQYSEENNSDEVNNTIVNQEIEKPTIQYNQGDRVSVTYNDQTLFGEYWGQSPNNKPQIRFDNQVEIEGNVGTVLEVPTESVSLIVQEHISESVKEQATGSEEYVIPHDIDVSELDPLVFDASKHVSLSNESSVSDIQNTFSVGRIRANNILSQMEILGIVGKSQDGSTYPVLITDADKLSSIFHELYPSTIQSEEAIQPTNDSPIESKAIDGRNVKNMAAEEETTAEETPISDSKNDVKTSDVLPEYKKRFSLSVFEDKKTKNPVIQWQHKGKKTTVKEGFKSTKEALIFLKENRALIEQEVDRIIEQSDAPKDITSKDTQRQFVSNVKILIKNNIGSGNTLGINDLRLAAKGAGVEVTEKDNILLQELSEMAVIELAKDVAFDPNLDVKEKFDRIVDIYNAQPSINMRSSSRIENQQYSTPIPMSFLADVFVNEIDPQLVLEPSAGNGMMVFAIPSEKVIVNEIDERRLDNLSDQGFLEVLSQDGKDSFAQVGTVDAVVTNPPFGASEAKLYGNYSIPGLAQQMSINSLEQLSESGRAVLIIGGNSSYKKNGLLSNETQFFNYLYQNFNVVDVVNVVGELYKKQGTTFPTRMIFIDGKRNQSIPNFPPLEKNANATPITTFEELFNRIIEQQNGKGQQNEQRRNEVSSVRVGELHVLPQRTEPNGGYNGDLQTSNDHANMDRVGDTGQQGMDSGSPKQLRRGRMVRGEHGDVGRSSGRRDNEPVVVQEGDNGGSSGTGIVDRIGSDKGGYNGSDAGNVSDRQHNVEKEPESQQPSLGDEKAAYKPKSESEEIGSVIPANMAIPIKNALDQIGDVDSYVMDRLGYNSKDDLYKALSAEQIDGVALAIRQIEQGKAFIIGDMTGVGKGRQAAAIIRYSCKQGQIPVFFTEKDFLFSDIYRDLVDIGSGDLVPFIVNDTPAAKITDNTGRVIYNTNGSVRKKVVKSKKLPKGINFVVCTYSQCRTAEKRAFVQSITQGVNVILDESHVAGGQSATGETFREVVKHSSGTVFLSGTFAKRADNMPIYAIKTDIGTSGVSTDELIDIIASGGVPLQELMSIGLSESGQMVRRERDFSGVTIDWKSIESNKEEQEMMFDSFAGLFVKMINFQRTYVMPLVDEMDMNGANDGKTIKTKKGTEDLGIKNPPFASKAFNLTRQVLLALKAKRAAQEAIDQIKAGNKPVIALSNTMEGFLDEFSGTTLDKIPDFGETLRRGVTGLLRITEKDRKGKEKHINIEVDQLSRDGQDTYNKLIEEVEMFASGMSISPIDEIKNTLRSEGYTVGEITGRKMELFQNEDGTITVRNREDTDKKSIVRGFNDGTVDVVIINQSGATGLSMHSSDKFSDKRPRVMINIQPQLDINNEIQLRGRIDRTGQVHRGKYVYLTTTIPAEQRMVMMLKAKLKSLDANTTSSQKSKTNEIDIVDFLNEYGDEVVTQWCIENPEIYDLLGDPLKFEDKGEDKIENIRTVEDAASKVSGRVALLPVKEQDRFYNEVAEAYNKLLQYHIDSGTNLLEITNLPLNATTVSESTYIKGRGDGSFSGDAINETVEVDVLKKPMTITEIHSLSEKLSEGKDLESYKDEIVGRIESAKSEETQKAEARIREKHDHSLSMFENKARLELKKQGIDDEASISNYMVSLKNSLDDKMINEIKTRTQKISNKYDSMVGKIKSFRNRVYSVSTDDSTATGSVGMFIGFSVGKKIVPSSVSAVFATRDGRRKIEIPLSKNNELTNIINNTILYDNLVKGERRVTDQNWDDSAIKIGSRTKATIITGNVIAAFSKVKGSLISYTTSDGTIKKGILLNKPIESNSFMSNISDQVEYIKSIPSGRFIESTNGEIILTKHRDGSFVLSIPSSKSKGGKYFLNEDIKSLVAENEFYQKGKKFISDVSESNLSKLAKVLGDMGIMITVSNQNNDSNSNRYRIGELSTAEMRESSTEIMKSAELAALELKSEVVFVSKDQSKRGNAKGWYDTSTGKVYIVLDNADSSADVARTVFHEVAGHRGLRILLGEHFDSFMDMALKNANEDVRRSIIEKVGISEMNSSSMRVALEEYLADIAEKGASSTPQANWFTKVKYYLNQFFMKAGVNPMFEFSDKDAEYLIWRSFTKLKSIDLAAKDVIIKRQIQSQPANASVELYRASESIKYDQELSKLSNKLFEETIDGAFSIKALQDSILEKIGGELTDSEDAYNLFLNKRSFIAAESDKNHGEFIEPLLNTITELSKDGLNVDDIDNYLIFKHGLERNRLMRERESKIVKEMYSEELENARAISKEKEQEVLKKTNKKLSEIENTDYSGIQSLADACGLDSDNYDQSAIDFVSEFEEDYNTTDLLSRVNAITTKTLERQMQSGIISKVQFDTISSMYENYVPLRGFDETTSDDLYDYVDSLTGSSKIIQRAKGRRSISESPIAQMCHMLDQSIRTAIDNEVKKSLVIFGVNRDSNLLKPIRQWYKKTGTNSTPIWEQVFPEIPENAQPKDIEAIMSKFEDEMLELEEQGHVKQKLNKNDIPARVLPGRISEHIVRAKIGGIDYSVVLSGDPKAAQVINNKFENRTKNSFLNGVSNATQYLAKLATTYNPAFSSSNFVRDVFSSTLYEYAEGGFDNLVDYQKTVWNVIPSISRALSGKLIQGNKYDDLLVLFVEGGGETGYISSMSLNDWKKRANKDTKDVSKSIGEFKKAGKFPFKLVLDMIGKLNRLSEMVSRFSAYAKTIENGGSHHKAIVQAKEITVNFNRKGLVTGNPIKNANSLSERSVNALSGLVQCARPFYMFFNANLQGTYKLIKTTLKNPKRMSVLLGSQYMVGALIMPLINELLMMMSDDEEKKWAFNNLPDYVKQNNICFFDPITGNTIKIPLAQGFRFFYAQGVLANDYLTNDYPKGELIIKSQKLFAEFVPLNYANNGAWAAPSVLQPFLDVLMNEDYKGSKISMVNDFNNHEPFFRNANQKTAELFIFISQTLNTLTDGDDVKQGDINVDPSKLDHVAMGFIGGAGRFWIRTANFAYGAAETINELYNDEDPSYKNFNLRNAPFVSTFVSNTDDLSQSKINEMYKKVFDKRRDYDDIISGYKKRDDDPKYSDKLEDLLNSEDYINISDKDDYFKDIGKLRKERKETDDPGYRDLLSKEIDMIKRDIVRGYYGDKTKIIK